VLPVFAPIGTFVNAGAGVGRAAGVDLSGAHPDGAAGPVHRDIPDGHHCFLIEERLEGQTIVLCFPEAARGVGNKEVGRILFPNINIGYPAAHDGRPYIAEWNFIENGLPPQVLPCLVAFHPIFRRSRGGKILRLQGESQEQEK